MSRYPGFAAALAEVDDATWAAAWDAARCAVRAETLNTFVGWLLEIIEAQP